MPRYNLRSCTSIITFFRVSSSVETITIGLPPPDTYITSAAQPTSISSKSRTLMVLPSVFAVISSMAGLLVTVFAGLLPLPHDVKSIAAEAINVKRIAFFFIL